VKRIALLAVAALVTLGLMPATAGAGAAPTGQVTIVHDATFNAPGSPFPVTVCIDGEVIDGDFRWGDTLGPLSLPADTYFVAVFVGADESCDGKTGLADELTVNDGDDITVAAIWPSTVPGLVVWPNDSSCYEPATSARLTVRHGAATDGPVDVAGIVNDERTLIISDLPEGGQQTVDVPGGLIANDVVVASAGNPDNVIIEVGDLTLAAGNHYVVYAGGGSDGGADVFVDVIPMDPCVVPVEPTTTITKPAPAAAAVTAAPKFTG